jgi:hypothetical protein
MDTFLSLILLITSIQPFAISCCMQWHLQGPSLRLLCYIVSLLPCIVNTILSSLPNEYRSITFRSHQSEHDTSSSAGANGIRAMYVFLQGEVRDHKTS